MVVKTIGNGRDVAGLNIGVRNARRYFDRSIAHAELQLGHLHIHCDLSAEFWQKPEITDPRLADWLVSRLFHGKAKRTPHPVTMVPLGKNSFRVLPYTLPAASANAMTRIGPPSAANRPHK
jgi:hypothetical protein